MRKTVAAAAGLIVGFSTLGCAARKPAATASTVQSTAAGGTILLSPGANEQAAVKDALAAMETHCRGVYEVVEITRSGTGQSVFSVGSTSYDQAGVAHRSSDNSAVLGVSFTYLCRKPLRTELNQIAANWAFLGLKCRTEKDCGGFPCERRNRSAANGVCARADGTLPLAREDEECFVEEDCLPPLICYPAGTCGFK